MDTTNILFISSGIMMLVLLVAIAAPMLIARRWNSHRANTVGQWEAEGVTFVKGPVGGKFVGLESTDSGRKAMGVGFIALTTEDLRVTRASPPGSWQISLRQIKGVALRSKFIGQRSKQVPFIVVRFTQDGQKDRLAFQVKEVDDWAKTLADEAGVKLKMETE